MTLSAIFSLLTIRDGSARKRALSSRLSGVISTLVALAVALVSTLAFAYEPPPLRGRINDYAGKLSPQEVARLERKLADEQNATGNEIVVFLVPTLDGEAIEDVAYETFNTWKIGQKGADNGVLLVIAPAERRVRIETGKGVGGALTDVQAGRIIREVVAPRLREDRFYDAIDAGTSAIAEALRVGGTEGKPHGARKRSQDGGFGEVAFWIFTILFVILFFASRGGRGGRGGGFFYIGGIGGGYGGGWGGGDGGGYSGGGGESGGGGASDSY